MHYYEYNIYKYQLHQMVKFLEIWVYPNWPQTCRPTVWDAQLLYRVFVYALHHSESR